MKIFFETTYKKQLLYDNYEKWLGVRIYEVNEKEEWKNAMEEYTAQERMY